MRPTGSAFGKMYLCQDDLISVKSASCGYSFFSFPAPTWHLTWHFLKKSRIYTVPHEFGDKLQSLCVDYST